jgi:hypothetical protein
MADTKRLLSKEDYDELMSEQPVELDPLEALADSRKRLSMDFGYQVDVVSSGAEATRDLDRRGAQVDHLVTRRRLNRVTGKVPA